MNTENENDPNYLLIKAYLAKKRRKRIGNICGWSALLLFYLVVEGYIIPFKEKIDIEAIEIAAAFAVSIAIKFIVQRLIK